MSAAKRPDSADIHSVVEQVNSVVEQVPDVPDWLWQGLLLYAAGKGIDWTWKHRAAIAQALRKQPMTREISALIETPTSVSLTITPVRASNKVGVDDAVTSTVGSERTAMWDVRANGGSERTALWNIEAPTPSLARRLEELASWYLHVS